MLVDRRGAQVVRGVGSGVRGSQKPAGHEGQAGPASSSTRYARPTGPDDPLVVARDRLLACFAAGLSDYRLAPETSLHALRMLRSTLHGFITLQATDGFQLDHEVQGSFAWLVTFLDHALRALAATSVDQRPPAAR